VAGHLAADARDDERQIGVIRLAVWGDAEDLRVHAARRGQGGVGDETAAALAAFGMREAEP